MFVCVRVHELCVCIRMCRSVYMYSRRAWMSEGRCVYLRAVEEQWYAHLPVIGCTGKSTLNQNLHTCFLWTLKAGEPRLQSWSHGI